MQATHFSSFDNRLYMPYLPKIINTFHYFYADYVLVSGNFVTFALTFSQ